MIFCFNGYPWASKNSLMNRTLGITSLTPTNSDSVELLVFNFCFFESEEKKLVIANIHQQNSTIPQKNLITVNKTSGNNYYIIPAEIIDITLFSTSGLPIIGAIIYAEDNKMNRVGRFLTFGENMQPFSACGSDNVGIVHNKELSENMYYRGIKWQAPSFLLEGCNKIIFKGLAVTDSGFGFHETEYLFVK